MSKYLDNDGLLYLWNSKIKPLVAKYLPLTGGTLTGKLKLSGAPTEDMDAATKKIRRRFRRRRRQRTEAVHRHAACLGLGCGFAWLPGADDHDHGAESVLRY